MTELLLPVGPRRMASWQAHQDRGKPSVEPGTDFYCPIGTPIIAPDDGVIWSAGNSIGPDTGRWVGINFDNGMSFRTMHHSRNVITSGRVRRGQVYAYSGASGYGEEDWSWNVAGTGGAHVHATLWPTHSHLYGYDRNGRPYTVDLMNYVGGALAGGGATPFDPEEDDMSAEAEAQIQRIHDALFNGREDTGWSERPIDTLVNRAVDTNNKVSVPGAGYGRPEVIQNAVDGLRKQLETGAGYDWLPAIANQGNAILAAVGRLTSGNAAPVDVEALASAIREGLGGEVADELAKRLSA